MAAKQGGKTKSSTPAQKDRRTKSWANGEKRKKARAESQHKRAERNRERRKAGEPTPWEIARQIRSERRTEAAKHKVGKQS